MNKSDNITDLAKALVLTQSELKTVIRGAENPFFKSKYADLSSIIESIRPILKKHDLCFLHIPDRDAIECVIMHTSGQYISGHYPILTQKNDPQALGSATTYAKRYSLSAMLGLATDDDDDANSAMEEKPISNKVNCTKCGATMLSSQFKDKATGRDYLYCSNYNKGCKERIYSDNQELPI